MEGGDRLAADVDDEQAAEAALDRFLPPEEHVVLRVHHVTALLVAHEGAPWLPRTLDGLAAQERPADAVVAVDAGSTDGGAALMAGRGLPVTDGGDARGLAEALAVAVAQQPSPSQPRSDDPEHARWFWIVHDDSAPEPDCLAALLEGADRNPSAVVLVPKSVAWSDPSRLVGIGHAWTPGTPVVDRLEPRERDQGQYDVDRPVYSGESAGMLVRADVWEALDGVDPFFGDWAGSADLCRRAWGAGHQVFFIPQAVVAHRRAGWRGARRGSPASPRRAAREGQLLLELTQAPGWALPWRWLRGCLSTVARALALLITREPEEATAELAGAWRVLGHPGRVRQGRWQVRRPPVVDLVRPPHLRAARGAVLGHALDEWAVVGGRRWSRLRPPPRVWRPLALAGVLALVALVRDPGLLLGAGTLRGGGLLPAPGAGALLQEYLASWHEVRLGLPGGLPVYLPLLALASVPLLGSVDALLRLVFTLAMPLAFLSAYASIGPRMAGRSRVALALVWALLPAGVAAAGAGRISTLAILLLGPPTARLLATAVSRARLPGTGIRPAVAAGTMLGVTVAFAPGLYGMTLLVLVLGWLARGTPRWALRTGLVVLGVAALFLALWMPRLLRAPWLLLTELGRNDASLGHPAPWVIGLAPGGPTSVPWPGLVLAVASVVAVLLWAPGRRALVALAAALLLGALVAWTPAASAVLWPELDPATLWPGQPLLVAGGLLALLLARATGAPGRTGAGMRAALWACVAVLGVGWWVAPSSLAVSRDSGLPPVVALDEESAARPRGLVLAREAGVGAPGEGQPTPSGAVRYGLSSVPEARLGDADALAGRPDDRLTEVVQELVSGAGPDVEAELGGRGVRYVIFNGAQEDPLVAELDAAGGLRRLASAPTQSLWLVSGQPVRAELVGSGAPDVTVPVLTVPTSIDVIVHPQAVLPRALVVAEQADPGWRARIADTPLPLSTDERGMLRGPVAVAGRLSLHHGGPWPYLALAQLVALVAVLVLSLPKRRSIDPDGEVRA